MTTTTRLEAIINGSRIRKYLFQCHDAGSEFIDGVAIAAMSPDGRKLVEIGPMSDRQFPDTTLVACAGKPILEVIDHPVTRERYGPDDVIEGAFWDDEAQVSVFEVRRSA